MTGTLALDARKYHDSGIGTYLQQVMPEILDRWPGAVRVLWSAAHPVPPAVAARAAEVRLSGSGQYSLGEQRDVHALARGAAAYYAPHYVAPLLAPCPLVVTVHDTAHLSLPAVFRNPVKRAAARVALRRAVGQAARVVTISEFSKAEIVRHTGAAPQKIAVAPNGVDHARFHPRRAGGDGATLERYGAAGPFVLFVGNIKPHKNLTTLLAAFAALPASVPATLILTGSAAGLQTVDHAALATAERLAASGRVRWCGRVGDDDLGVLYRHAVAVVQPSRYEGFGLPVLEGMACGAPVIASDIPALREAGGDAALYYGAPDDAAALGALLERVLTGALPLDDWRRRAVAHAAGYTWDAARAAVWDAVAASAT